MANNRFESNAAPTTTRQDEWLLKSLPYPPSQFTQWAIAAVMAVPFALATGFVLTAQAADGALALPLIASGIHRLIGDLFRP